MLMKHQSKPETYVPFHSIRRPIDLGPDARDGCLTPLRNGVKRPGSTGLGRSLGHPTVCRAESIHTYLSSCSLLAIKNSTKASRLGLSGSPSSNEAWWGGTLGQLGILVVYCPTAKYWAILYKEGSTMTWQKLMEWYRCQQVSGEWCANTDLWRYGLELPSLVS